MTGDMWIVAVICGVPIAVWIWLWVAVLSGNKTIQAHQDHVSGPWTGDETRAMMKGGDVEVEREVRRLREERAKRLAKENSDE